jgi:uncharacterized protein YdaU (DUF1376 family)
MPRRNWMPLYIPDFLADTMHLSAVQTGAYLCLIMDYWLHDGLPDDDRKLASIARVSRPVWLTMRPTIQAFFHDGWQHKRIDAELGKMVVTATRRQEAARKAGTVSAMNRLNGATPGARGVNAASTERSTSRARSVNHTTQVSKITTSEVGTAREGTHGESGEKPPKPPISASDGLAEVIAKKGWVA